MRVRGKQLQAMAQTLALEHFEHEMVGHLRGFSPWHAKTIGDDGVRRTIRLGIRRAEIYGVTSPGSLRFYVELMFMFGSSFDTDPLLPWAGDVLRDPGVAGEGQRMGRLHASLLAYLEAVNGSQRSGSLDALRAIQRLSRQNIPVAEIRDVPWVISTMKQVYPGFCTYVGDSRLRELVRRGRDEAVRLDLRTEHGEVLVTGMMFTIGHGFAEDPLYPWVRATLQDPSLGSPAARVAALGKQAATLLDSALTCFERTGTDAAV